MQKLKTKEELFEQIHQKLNKELLYEIYLKMKNNVDEGYLFFKQMEEQLWDGNDDDCKLIHSMTEGILVLDFHFIIPDKNVNEVIGVNMIDENCRHKLDRGINKKRQSCNQFDSKSNLFPNFPLYDPDKK